MSSPPKTEPRPDQDPALAPGSDFSGRFAQLKSWRDELAAAIAAYQEWAEQQGAGEGEQDLRVYELIRALQADKLTVAFVGEFSRGKSELLNAVFFADLKQRLLPSGAGRTTRCPIELRYDENAPPCVRLLPVETRRTAMSISDYKLTPVHWTTIHLYKPDNAEELREAFTEVTRTKKIHIREAQELGLYDPARSRRSDDLVPENGLVEIPVWRHAIVNYPHPFLRQGLVVLDTPGLNALGTEPELTLGILSGAQVLLFVLAADTGVTRSDLGIWNLATRGASRAHHLVALNKTDILWDELAGGVAVAASIATQVAETGRALGVDVAQVLPVSAQKGLVGKIKGDASMVTASGLPALERRLADEMIPARHAILRDRIVREVGGRIEATRALLDARLADSTRELAGLKQLGGKNLDAIQKMVARVRDEKQKYDRELEGFHVTRAALTEHAGVLLGFLSLKSFDELIAQSRQSMHDSWTTVGLQDGMATFFRGVAERLAKVEEQAGRIRRIIVGVYGRLHTEFGLPTIDPPALMLATLFEDFLALETEAEAFRKNPLTVMTEQHYVIKKFFITLASRARALFQEGNELVKGWFQAAVSPVSAHVQQHKAAIERQLETLRRIQKDMDSLGGRIAKLEQERQYIEAQRRTADALLARIAQPLP
jgi:hypothetical protein